MRWSERQLAMLREMGIRIWAPETARATEAPDSATLVDERMAEQRALPAAPPVARAPTPAHVRADDRPLAPPSLLSAHPAATLPTATSGLVSAEWLVVGEPFTATAVDAAAVSEQELLLDNMLRSIRVSRRSPSREGRACHLAIAPGDAAAAEAAIEVVRPRCILALGRAAAAALLGADDAPLGRLRERLHERAGVPVIVTFALPYLLRHAEDKPRAWADLCRAVTAIG